MITEMDIYEIINQFSEEKNNIVLMKVKTKEACNFTSFGLRLESPNLSNKVCRRELC